MDMELGWDLGKQLWYYLIRFDSMSNEALISSQCLEGDFEHSVVVHFKGGLSFSLTFYQAETYLPYLSCMFIVQVDVLF